MKKVEKFLKKNKKLIGILVIAIIISGIGVFATGSSYAYESGSVFFDNTNANLTLNDAPVTTVQGALDALFFKASNSSGSSANDDTCPGADCLYLTKSLWEWEISEMFTTWNTLGQTPTKVSLSDYTTDFTATSDSEFLGVKINSDNEIERAFVCQNLGGIAVCIEGYSDGRYYTTNVSKITPWYGLNRCGGNSDYYYCSTSTVSNNYNSAVFKIYWNGTASLQYSFIVESTGKICGDYSA